MLKRDKKHFKHTFKMAIVPATTFNYAAGRKRSNQANTIIMEISVTFTIRSRGADKKTPADWRRGSPQLWLTKKRRSGESGPGRGRLPHKVKSVRVHQGFPVKSNTFSSTHHLCSCFTSGVVALCATQNTRTAQDCRPALLILQSDAFRFVFTFQRTVCHIMVSEVNRPQQ